ncbi:MAG: hypothetical protein ACLGGV_07675 [Bacteroidia bacterium]
MEWLTDPLADFFVWSFDTLLVPFENMPNWAFLTLGFVGLLFWLNKQANFNNEAKENPNQIK